MLTKTKSLGAILFYFIVLIPFYSCVKLGSEFPIENDGQFLEGASIKR